MGADYPPSDHPDNSGEATTDLSPSTPRPTHRFTQLWNAATEAERAELLPLLVKQVEMKDKERGIVRLVFETDFSALNFATAQGDCGITARLREDNGN